MSETVADLAEIMNNPNAAERRKLLIKRGWELQRAEAKTKEDRAYCDWMIGMIDLAEKRKAT